MASFFRVIQVGFLLPSHALAVLQSGRPAVNGAAFGRRCAIAVRFEPKVGGGGHVLFSSDTDPESVQRLIIEPHARGWLAAVFLTEADYQRPDEAFVVQIRIWLAEMFQLSPEAEGVGLRVKAIS